MVKGRIKLAIPASSGLPMEDILEALSDRFDVSTSDDSLRDAHAVLVSPHSASGSLAPGDADAMLDAIGEGVCLASITGETIWANRWFRSLPADVLEAVSAVCREAAAWFNSTQGRRATLLRRFDLESESASRVFEIDASPIRDGSGVCSIEDPGPAVRIACVVRDITEARLRSNKLDALDRAGAELVQLDRNQISKLNAVQRLQMLERKIARSLSELLQFDNFAIWLRDEKDGHLECVMNRGLPDEVQGFRLEAAEDGNGICGQVAATGRSYICVDAESDPLFIQGMSGARSSLTVPLRLLDKVIGVLDIESTEAAAFGEEDRQYTEIFARHIALALHMLDALVAERSTVNRLACDRVEGELAEPLDDILAETEAMLGESSAGDAGINAHLERIRSDVAAIRRRVKDVASGPQTLLGIERALEDRKIDPVLKSKRILIADDEAKIRRVLGDVLKHRGAIVELFSCGGDAMRRLAKADPKRDRFDLIISDIRMPDHNGYEIFSAARKTLPDIPVILMTGFGYDPHHSIVRASQEGLKAVLFKPFPIEKMIDEVKEALTEADSRAKG